MPRRGPGPRPSRWAGGDGGDHTKAGMPRIFPSWLLPIRCASQPITRGMSMAATRMLRTFLRRTAKGEYSLEAEDGSLVLRSRTYRDLRRDMRVVLAALGLRLEDVKVFLGAP